MQNQINPAFTATLMKQCFICFERGEIDDAKSLLISFLQQCEPVLIPYFERSKRELKEMNYIREHSEDPSAVFSADVIIKYFERKGITHEFK